MQNIRWAFVVSVAENPTGNWDIMPLVKNVWKNDANAEGKKETGGGGKVFVSYVAIH
jgi:hypothetical protein